MTNLFVLDPPGNAIWIYGADEKMEFSGPPSLFFSGNLVPTRLDASLDIAVAGTDLYLLFNDGHVTHCTPGVEELIPIRCNDPETLVDTRPGHQSGPILTDALLTQMTFTSPPDPSLYMLEPLTASIYRFSPRPDALNMQSQFRAAVGQAKSIFTSPVSAMAISPNRYIFLSVGNQIYYASDVP